ncbi:MAG: GNAT family N-acetyltransferase, partial [Chloroflexota bacterium]
MTKITLRPAHLNDRSAVLAVEKKSTPSLQYLPYVYELFLNDPQGEFTVAEIGGQIVACAKFSVLPDGSGWLETIRVDPQYQGLGVGKRFYENYAAIAKRSGVSATRMYTGINNAVSAGLAARYG